MNKQNKHIDTVLGICREGKSFTCNINGNCMEGILPDGCKIEVEALEDFKNLSRGDIAVVNHSGLLITHRFLGVIKLDNQPYLFCKGDHSRRPDPLWHPSKLLGVVRKSFSANNDSSENISNTFKIRLRCFLQFIFYYALILFQLKRGRIFVERMGASFEIETDSSYEKLLLINSIPDILPIPSGDSNVVCRIIVSSSTDIADILEDRESDFSAEKIKVYVESNFLLRIVKESDVSIINAIEIAFRLFAVNYAVENAGFCIHASSVKGDEGIYIFAGRSGTGKTTCRNTFPAQNRLDDDFVLVVKTKDGFMRKNWSPFIPNRMEDVVTKVFVPDKEKDFCLTELSCREALKNILNLPPEGSDKDYAESFFDAAVKFGDFVSFYKLAWRKEDSLAYKL